MAAEGETDLNADATTPAPDLPEWLSWAREELSRWVSARPEPVVMGWPYNGTRRWYLVNSPPAPDPVDYLRSLVRRQGEHHRLVFEHGVSALLAPSFGMETLKRGPEYTRYALGGLLEIANDEVYSGMFESGVRLRFYGDYASVLDVPEYRPMLEACNQLVADTASGEGPLLFIGLFADDPYPAIVRLSVEFEREHGRTPDRRELVEAYYGLPVPDLSLYLGFGQPEMFDVPLVTTGLEHLYVTVNPSPDLTERQLREILYDHLVTRNAPPVDYESLSPEAVGELSRRTERASGKTIGLGRIDPLTGLWNPVLPEL